MFVYSEFSVFWIVTTYTSGISSSHFKSFDCLIVGLVWIKIFNRLISKN